MIHKIDITDKVKELGEDGFISQSGYEEICSIDPTFEGEGEVEVKLRSLDGFYDSIYMKDGDTITIGHMSEEDDKWYLVYRDVVLVVLNDSDEEFEFTFMGNGVGTDDLGQYNYWLDTNSVVRY